MRRIKNSDIKLYYKDFKGITPYFKLHFYTTNSEYAIEKTVTDLFFDLNDDYLGYIILNWSELQSIGKGVMNYTLYTYQNDSDFDDGVYNKSFSRTTEYFIDTNLVIEDEEEEQSISQLIAEVDVKVNEEVTRSTEKDIEHDEALTTLQNEYDYLEGRHRRDIDALSNEKVNRVELATVATTGDYNDLINKPTIPTNISSFNNDIGYLIPNDISGKVNRIDLARVATSGSYADLQNRPTKVSAFTNDAGYLTQHQDISGKADKADTYTKAQVNSAIAALEVGDLEDRVDQLETDYMNLSQTHARDIEAELTGRQNADEILQDHIDTEATARQNADAALQTAINGKQPMLTAGANITIDANNVISASGGSSVAQVQADWNQSDSTAVDYIKNKPTIPTVPTNVSAFTNDAGYLTSHQSLSGYATETWVSTNYYNKTYIDTMIGNIETLLSNI